MGGGKEGWTFETSQPLWRPVSGHEAIILKISFLESHVALEWLAAMSR